MTNKILILFCLVVPLTVCTQVFTTNTTPTGMEHNVLFNAESRFSVTQTGSEPLVLSKMFDGKFAPSYTAGAPSPNSPTVILIEDLPRIHTQAGAWIGWSTRYWQANRFKIEGFDEHNGNIWKTLADYSNTDYTGGRSFTTKVSSGGRYTKLRFTFYSATGRDGRLGVSELFFIHPEAVSPYEGLLSTEGESIWNQEENHINYTGGYVGIGTNTPSHRLEVDNGNYRFKTYSHGTEVVVNTGGGWARSLRFMNQNDSTTASIGSLNGTLFFSADYDSQADPTGYRNRSMIINADGNVGIGTTNPKGFKLGVNGNIAAEEVRVALYTNWPDFVFDKDYHLPSLYDVEQQIQDHGHLSNIPSAENVHQNGFFLGQMDAKLLQKIEELTLYTIQQEKRIAELEQRLNDQEILTKRIERLEMNAKIER